MLAFKSQMKIGWIHRIKEIELMSYDNIGMAYYYMGNLDSAKYYHNRMVNQVIEPSNSLQFTYCVSTEELKKKQVLMNSSIKSCRGFNEFSVLGTRNNEERDAMVLRQFEISTDVGETPRIIHYEPMTKINLTDLPSPRKIDLASSNFESTISKKKLHEELSKKRQLMQLLKIRAKNKVKHNVNNSEITR